MSDVNTIEIAAISKTLIVLAITNQTTATTYGGTFTVAIAPLGGTEPTTFASPDTADGSTGIMGGPGSTVGTLAVGWYQPWVKITGVSPEIPAIPTPQKIRIY
jgi:hypothetical protein